MCAWRHVVFWIVYAPCALAGSVSGAVLMRKFSIRELLTYSSVTDFCTEILKIVGKFFVFFWKLWFLKFSMAVLVFISVSSHLYRTKQDPMPFISNLRVLFTNKYKFIQLFNNKPCKKVKFHYLHNRRINKIKKESKYSPEFRNFQNFTCWSVSFYLCRN